jgi:gag-polypeptide of LTR copia-type
LRFILNWIWSRTTDMNTDVTAVLFMQITTMKYATGTPIQTHQLKMEEVRQKPMAAGQRISDSEFLSYFLNSLPAELDQFTTTVNHTTDTIASVTTRLRQTQDGNC